MKIYNISKVFPSPLVYSLLAVSEQFEWGELKGKRTDNPNRVWMNQYDWRTFKVVCQMMNDMKDKFDIPKSCKTRIELCKDKKGSWLEHHVDDPAKVFTMQIYLTDLDKSTYFEDMTPTEGKVNTGWYFYNTGSEWHGLEPLDEDRISIIVNYVNSEWRDKSVLC